MSDETVGSQFVAHVIKNAERIIHYDKNRLIQFLEMEKFIPPLYKIENVKLCENCEGVGIYYWDELTDYHKGIYDTYSKVCSECKGSGRILDITYTSSQKEPFIPKNK